MQRSVAAIFQTFKVSPHLVRLPTGILRQMGDVFPIRIVGIDQYLGVMGGAASESTGPWIKPASPLGAVLRIEPLLVVIRVMTNIKVPFHGAVFGGKGMERRNVVVSGQAVRIRLNRIAALEFSRVSAGFEQDD